MNSSITSGNVAPASVHPELRKHMLIDGFDFVLDAEKSGDGYYADAISGKRYLDFFSCFASVPLRLNHPRVRNDEFIRHMGLVALQKPSNSDLYTETMAEFVKTLFELAVPKHFHYSFFIEGGALANENALKVAFDWKVRKNFAKGYKKELGTKIIHFAQAFHGRSGYTMSLTNTDPTKVALYPKFTFPRISNPKLRFPLTDTVLAEVVKAEAEAEEQIVRAFADHRDDIAAIIIEPIQGEGGDNHFRPEFLRRLRELADEHEALLIFDEVQTGVGMTGSWWACEQLGVMPDILSFGKKMQVCGILVSDRIDDVPDNVFHTSSRINSTWGGNLVDMARATRYLQIIHEEALLANAAEQGAYLCDNMKALENRYPDKISNIRGRGLFAAFDVKDAATKSAFLHKAYDNGMLILGCGDHSIRFRPTLDVSRSVVDEALGIIESSIKTV